MFLTSFAKAQECGYTFLTIFLTDSKKELIKNAKIDTFDENFKEKFFLYPKDKTSYDQLERSISWSEEKQAYYGSEGMCGGHKDIGFRISAEGSETFDKVIDLSLGWTSHSIKLKRNGTSEIAESVKLMRISGEISDLINSGIPKVRITAFSREIKVSETFTDLDGNYELFLPVGQYNLEINADGFIKSIIKSFSILNDKNFNLDLKLEVKTVAEHPPVTASKK